MEDGSLVTYGGLGLLWYAKQEYGDFSLKMSWKVEDGTDNAGVFVRFPNTGTVSQTAIDQGHEIQIHEGENTSEPQKTGSVYNFKREERRNSNPIGEWNDYEIRAKGLTIQVLLNGQVVEHLHRRGAADQGDRLLRPPEPRRQLAGALPLRADQGARGRRAGHDRHARSGGAGRPSGFYTGPGERHAAARRTPARASPRPSTASTAARGRRYSGAVRVADDGAHVLEYRSTDRDGNVEDTKKRRVRDRHRRAGHDRDARSGAAGAGPYRVPVTLTLTATDGDGLRRGSHRALGQRRRVGALHGPARRSTENGNYRVAVPVGRQGRARRGRPARCSSSSPSRPTWRGRSAAPCRRRCR